MNRPQQSVPGAPISSQLARVPQANINRSRFDLSNVTTHAIEAGYLYPLYVRPDVLPGDTFDLSVSTIIEMVTLKQVLKDALWLDFHWWFVPNRLVMSDWPLLMGERPDPDSSIDVLVPYVDAEAGFAPGSYADYLGWPTGVSQVNMPADAYPTALALRALMLTFNTWYRDQNLIDSVPINLGNTADVMGDFPMLRRGKRKDPYTSMLPWPQKGADVTIPMGTSAPVTGTTDAFFGPNFDIPVIFPTTTGVTSSDDIEATAAGGQITGYQNGVGGENVTPLVPAGMGFSGVPFTGSADLTTATAVTINALRLAVAMQQTLELFARGGTRYPEVIQSLFAVTNPDFRLQRPEFLGGGSIPINVHPVVNLTQGSGSTLGNRAAFGHAQAANVAPAVHSFTEHGQLLLVASVRQEYTYWQGMDPIWTKRSMWEHYMPTLANLGEQAVKTWQLLLDGSSQDDVIIGYQPRWEEYRWQKSFVTGIMRPSHPLSLASWHLAQQFTNTPDPLELSQDFIEENPPIARVVQVTDQPPFIIQLAVKNHATRPLPLTSDPGLRSL